MKISQWCMFVARIFSSYPLDQVLLYYMFLNFNTQILPCGPVQGFQRSFIDATFTFVSLLESNYNWLIISRWDDFLPMNNSYVHLLSYSNQILW